MRVLRKLYDLVAAYQKNDPEAVRAFFFNHPEFSEKPVNSASMETILFGAAVCNNSKITNHVVSFLKLGAKSDFMKQLIIAVLQGNVKAVEKLLKNNPSLRSLKYSNYTCLPAIYSAVFLKSKNRKNFLKLMLQYDLIDPKFCTQVSENLLHILTQVFVDYHDTMELAEILINAGVPVNEYDDNGFSPLCYAVEFGNFKLTSMLIKSGADVNIKNEHHQTVMHWAARCNYIEDIADLLVSSGSGVEARDFEGWTPLHGACHYHNDVMIRFLIRQGAAISPKNAYGETPFFLLDEEGPYYDLCVIIMVKEFAKMTREKILVSDSDMNLMYSEQRARDHYENSVKELDQMAGTKFYGPYTYYSVLKKSMSLKKLANLTQNKEIVWKFRADSRSKFPYYDNDLERILVQAIQLRNESKIVVIKLNSTFGNFLPKDIIRMVSGYLTIDDLPSQ